METILVRLQNVQRSPGGASARCPAHDDRQNSVSVGEAEEDGRVLLHCHAGCTVESIVTALGMTVADLFPANASRSRPRSRIVATYSYSDEAGTLLFEVVRYEPKTFRQRRPDGQGGWIWNLKGVRRVLFLLPQLLEAIKAGKTIYLVEGEKDALALNQEAAREGLHIFATCNPGGAGKWRREYSLLIGGAEVVIVADKDKVDPKTGREVGRAHAFQIGQSLIGIVSAVRVVEAREGKDAADHLAAGFGVSDFEPVALPVRDVECKSSQDTQVGDENLGTALMGVDEIIMESGLATLGEKPTMDAVEVALARFGVSLQSAGPLQRVLARESAMAILKDAGFSAPAMVTDTALWREGNGDERQDPSQATRLVEIAKAEASLFHTPESKGFADVVIAGHRETWALRSTGFHLWLSRRFYELEKKAPGSQAFTDAIAVLEGEAVFGGPELPVFIRIASSSGMIFIDLGRDAWEVVEISPEHWRVVAESPVRFRRARGMMPLPIPVSGGQITELWRFLNLATEEDFRLVVGWLLASLRDKGPYPIAVIQGEQGTAKSTFARVLRSCVDPSTVLLRRPPSNEHDLAIAANNSRIVAFDNLSGLPPWLSDALCALATGGGFGARELYSDADEMLFDATRPVIINGIDDLITRPDLTDRALVFRLLQIEEGKRRAEEDFWKDFEQAQPRILGALLDGVSAALRNLPHVRLERSPRMADFGKWATAAEQSFGWEPGSFMSAYTGNRSEAVELGLDSDVVADAVRGLLAVQSQWEGTAKDLLEALEARISESTKRSRSWPKGARALSNRLRRLAPSLRAVQIAVVMGIREARTGSRLIKMALAKRDSSSIVTCVTSVTEAGILGFGPDAGDEEAATGDAANTDTVTLKSASGLAGDDGDDGDASLLLSPATLPDDGSDCPLPATNEGSRAGFSIGTPAEGTSNGSCVTCVTSDKDRAATPFSGDAAGDDTDLTPKVASSTPPQSLRRVVEI